MPHADSSLVPSSIITKTQFWDHVYNQLESLLDGQRNWVTNLSNASSLVYNSLQSFQEFGNGDRMVNWCGFYLESSIFPGMSSHVAKSLTQNPTLLLGPFNGKPACQLIHGTPGRGVCADAFAHEKTVIVEDVNTYPGHIACDGETKSEIVIPLIIQVKDESLQGAEDSYLVDKTTERCIGVMDLDCLAIGGFTDEDKVGLEKLVKLIAESCDWI
ncbi:hypothetical protein FRC02_004781 [Tulasnella sp. 418]|nr:hypothetical protein FRC02_004781 [Tulasnella sp. 418]